MGRVCVVRRKGLEWTWCAPFFQTVAIPEDKEKEEDEDKDEDKDYEEEDDECEWMAYP